MSDYPRCIVIHVSFLAVRLIRRLGAPLSNVNLSRSLFFFFCCFINGRCFSSHTRLGTTTVFIKIDVETVTNFVYTALKVVLRKKKRTKKLLGAPDINNKRLLYSDLCTPYKRLRAVYVLFFFFKRFRSRSMKYLAKLNVK